MKEVCLLSFLCNWTRIKLSYRTIRSLPYNSAPTFQPEASCYKQSPGLVNILQKEGLLTVRSSVGFTFNLSGFVTVLSLLINQILNYWGNWIIKGKQLGVDEMMTLKSTGWKNGDFAAEGALPPRNNIPLNSKCRRYQHKRRQQSSC